MLNQEEVHRVAEEMLKYGGGFVKALGKALLLADYENQYKIKSAFADYWKKYSK